MVDISRIKMQRHCNERYTKRGRLIPFSYNAVIKDCDPSFFFIHKWMKRCFEFNLNLSKRIISSIDRVIFISRIFKLDDGNVCYR